jgi:glyoxylase-like metal-dependent hydrolase (beta-lactamase superfamily II)
MDWMSPVKYGMREKKRGGTMSIPEVRPRLYLVGLKQEIEGLDRFISSWVFNGELKFLVDVGPKASAHYLIDALTDLGVHRLDFIFLTHIHIDHAGGTGSLLRHFPEARVVCHPAGVSHLIHPEKLWEGSKKVLGEIALKYGEIDPVPAGNLLSSDEFTTEGFELIKTPGHAVHHLSLVYDRYLFAGEAGGVFRNLGNQLYLRPSTPPRFILEEAVGSIDRLLELKDKEICYAHFGIHPDAREMLTRYREQIYLWRDVIADQTEYPDSRDLIDRCVTALLKEDMLFRSLTEMTAAERKAELNFLANNIRGYLEYLALSRK